MRKFADDTQSIQSVEDCCAAIVALDKLQKSINEAIQGVIGSDKPFNEAIFQPPSTEGVYDQISLLKGVITAQIVAICETVRINIVLITELSKLVEVGNLLYEAVEDKKSAELSSPEFKDAIMTTEELLKQLRILRQKRKAILEDVSRATGISISYLSQLERGGRKPSPEVTKKLANYCNVTLSDS